uniref:Uncharacterized protein n=1 Tax=Nelumbo nucifera TaxID=4432 RepID=A0A822YSG7_NELNU|nr:TPA_asm: hypothetical protein HUJ06_004645 [Nelumbo nucifera]
MVINCGSCVAEDEATAMEVNHERELDGGGVRRGSKYSDPSFVGGAIFLL